VFLAMVVPGRADCYSSCDSNYYSCVRSYGERSCSTTRSICSMRCTIGGNRHGAIAYSESTRVYGYSYDFGSPGDARREAVAQCRKQHAGAADCKVLVVFGERCAALARGGNGSFGYASGSSEATVNARAMAECQARGSGCAVSATVCSGR
jgi:hypothetical protein